MYSPRRTAILFFAKPRKFVAGETFYNTGTIHSSTEKSQKILLALSLADGKAVWSYPQDRIRKILGRDVDDGWRTVVLWR